MRIPGVVGPTYVAGDSKQALAEVCQNWYAHPLESQNVQQNPYAKAAFILVPTPGIELQLEIAGATSIVAMTSTLGRLFVVARYADGDDLLEIRPAGAGYEAVKRVDIPMSGSGPVSLVTMGDTGKLLMVIANRNVHYFNLGDVYDATDMVLDGQFAWYENVASDAQFGAQADGFFLRLDSVLNEVGVSPLFGRRQEVLEEQPPVQWVYDANSDIDTGLATDLQCLGGDTSAERLWTAIRGSNALMAWDFDGSRRATDDIAIPSDVLSSIDAVYMLFFTAGYLYIAHRSVNKVVVVNRTTGMVDATREFAVAFPNQAQRGGLAIIGDKAYLTIHSALGGSQIRVYDLTTGSTYGDRIEADEFSTAQLTALGITRLEGIAAAGDTLYLLHLVEGSRRVTAVNRLSKQAELARGDMQALEKAGHSPHALWYDSTVSTGEAADGAGRIWLVNEQTIHLHDIVERVDDEENHPELVWDPLQTVKRSTGADRWQAMIERNRELFVFGEETTDVMTNVGAFPFPFAFNRNYFLEVGILAPRSLAISGQTPVWVGQTKEGLGYVYRLDGYSPRRISTAAVEAALKSVPVASLQAASAWAYEDRGHSFYVLTVPRAGVHVGL